MYKFCFSQGLTYDQARRVTIWELNLRLQSKKEKDEADLYRLAVLASWVTAPHLKKAINPDQLVNINRAKLTKEQKRADVERKMQFYNRLKDESCIVNS